MAIDRSGDWWTGADAEDIDEYLVAFTADGYPAERVVHSRCAECGGTEFKVLVDDAEGCAVRECVSCGQGASLLDSEEYLQDAELLGAACPCGGEVFNAAVGFAHHAETSDVRWVYLGLRCVKDGVLGCYADWKIDYSPTSHLYAAV